MTPPIADFATVAEARAATLRLLGARAAGATLCPSEVARALAAAAGTADWRAAMPAVHAAVDALAAVGEVRLSWKGEALGGREGPYRIGRGEGHEGNTSSAAARRGEGNTG